MAASAGTPGPYSAERLQALITGIRDFAIFTTDADGRVDYWNPAAEAMFGYTPEEIRGCSYAILFTPEDRAAGVFESELAQAGRSGRAEDDRYHLRKDGSRLFCSGVLVRLPEAAGNGFGKVARDLSRPHEAGVALQQAHDLLELRVDTGRQTLREETVRRRAAQGEVRRLLQNLVTAQEVERAHRPRPSRPHWPAGHGAPHHPRATDAVRGDGPAAPGRRDRRQAR